MNGKIFKNMQPVGADRAVQGTCTIVHVIISRFHINSDIKHVSMKLVSLRKHASGSTPQTFLVFTRLAASLFTSVGNKKVVKSVVNTDFPVFGSMITKILVLSSATPSEATETKIKTH